MGGQPVYVPGMLWVLALSALACVSPENMAGFQIQATRDYRVGDLPIDVAITAVDQKGNAVGFCGTARVTGLRWDADKTPITEVARFQDGRAVFAEVVPRGDAIAVSADLGERTVESMLSAPEVRRLPGVMSIIPPLFAIILAVLVRQALLALFAGVWIGALFVHGYAPFAALLRTFDTYLPATLVDGDHAALILFTMALGGMVGIITKSGGTKALVDAIATRARSRRSGMLTAWVAGLVVFFDDYANCLLVGNTVRPFTDRLRISREKLAYIVDSTAAPVATVALISTWIGYQIGLFDDVFKDMDQSGYQLFLDILPYSFYSFLSMAFVLTLAVTVRDFGPMARAERRAAREGLLVRDGAQPLMDRDLTDMQPDDPSRSHWSTAVIPVASVIVIVFLGLYISGVSALGADADKAGLRDIVAKANSYAVLLWASFGGSLIALITALARRTISMPGAVDAWIGGVKAMTVAVAILVLAWALGAMCKDHLQTGAWVLSQFQPSPHWIPIMTFVVSGIIALTTGSSYSTMAIVIPIAGPLAWSLTGDGAGLDVGTAESIRHATLAAVLSGAVFGDHCSPISDTTIMSSMSSASDHIDHVRTQAPYALVCAGVAGFVGFLPAGYGISPIVTLPLGIALLVAILMIFGRRPDADDTGPKAVVVNAGDS